MSAPDIIFIDWQTATPGNIDLCPTIAARAVAFVDAVPCAARNVRPEDNTAICANTFQFDAILTVRFNCVNQD